MKRKRVTKKPLLEEESSSLVEREAKRRRTDPTLFSPFQETKLDILFGYNDFYEFHGPLKLIFLYIPFCEIIDTSFKVCKNFYLASIQSLWKRNMINGDEVEKIFNINPSKGIIKLLYDMRAFDFSINDNKFLIHCCFNGYHEFVKVLLKEKNIDPSADNNYAIICASQNGHLETVRLLLSDNRVDPSDCDNCAVRVASRYGHLETVELLLSDDRVDLCN